MRRALDSLLVQLHLDPLTGLLNSSGLRDAEPVRATVLYLDLDDFKSINDTFGHATGDEVLKAVACVLRRLAIDGGGVAARVGGDEFVLAVPALNDELALQRLMRSVRSVVEVPLSVGAARCEAVEDLTDALARADRAMYADKRARRGIPSSQHLRRSDPKM